MSANNAWLIVLLGIASTTQTHMAPGKIYDYRFVPSEIKLPILNSILRSGWKVRYGMW